MSHYDLPSDYDNQFSPPDGEEWAPGLGGYPAKEDDFDEVEEFRDMEEE